MNIDGSTMLLTRRGLQPAEAQAARSGNNAFQVRTRSSDDALEAFAQEMSARISQAAPEGQDGQKDASTVVGALTESLEWLEERFGQSVSTAAMGMVMASTQAGASEESVSNGMLRVLQMVDNNFGFSAGDEAMARFNGALNNALNSYYDNGIDERFLAVYQDGSITDGLSLKGDSLVMKRDFARQAMDRARSTDETAPDPAQDLMEALLEDMNAYGTKETDLTRTGLETSDLEQSLAEGLAESQALRLRQAQAAYGWTPSAQADVLNLAV